LRLILESNEKRKEEVNDKTINEEVKKVAERAEALEKDLTRQQPRLKTVNSLFPAYPFFF